MKYPIYFYGNTCIHCGSNGSLTFVDRMGKETRRPIYPICKMICKECNTEYFVKWIKNFDETLVPVCVSKDEITKFEKEIVQFAMQNKRIPK